MPFRIVVQIGDRTHKHLLEPGRLEVGSSTDCAVRVVHPTVSRRHAAIEVSEAEVLVSDLGSSNGTRLDGKAVTAPTRFAPGSSLVLGSVDVQLELVDAGDAEVAVTLPSDPLAPVGNDLREVTDGPVSTIGPAVLQTFGLGELPLLVDRVVAGEQCTEVAQAVGESLLRSMPCRWVEVLSRDHGSEAVLFTGHRSSQSDAFEVVACSEDGLLEVHIGFVSPAFAQVYEPLVKVAAGLITLAGRRAPARLPRPPVEAAEARPPDPPSVVSEVRELYAQAARVARSRVSVLITGESGTGKELLARFLHAASDRADSALVTLNCAALPRDLLESELFGVERGVATGVEARPGRFEAAHGGTLFLDEIGDMALETQAKILRVLQEGEVYRVGGQFARPADVRVIAATNRDLETMLVDGGFRSDLYHRIADWVVELPPLRRRRADIPNLAAHFLARSCAQRDVRATGISRSAVEALQSFSWPGNVRQLEKEMARAALFIEDGDILDSSQLQPSIALARETAPDDTLKSVLETAERQHIERMLGECDGAVSAAAERLGVGVSTLYRRMKTLGIGE